ncbi:MAG: Trk system potassium transporter TrkA [Oscillospiraceae bacterium]|jgi:trk system potassium uptake protein TrkA|nr:Trk system potassium transporter TrkA [Oscillospiraceae bacterium]
MNIIIVGDGKVGHALAERLSQENHQVTIIDTNAEKLADSASVLDISVLKGNGASMDVQLEAGVQGADLLIAAASSDEINMICCLMAKKLGAKNTIARIRNPEYKEQMSMLEDEFNLSMTINPESYTASEISKLIRFPTAIRTDSFANGRVDIVELKIKPGNPLIGVPLKSIGRQSIGKILICVREHGGEVEIPNGDTVFCENDKIHITGSGQEIHRFLKSVGEIEQKIKSVLIIGGGKVSYYLAQLLETMDMYITIIEKNPRRCEELCEEFPEANIVCGDGTDQEILNSEGFQNVDAFISLTDIDEENIVASICAAEQKIKKVITKINRSNYFSILEKIGAGSTVSPKTITADRVARYIRAMQNTEKSGFDTLYKIAGGKAEALEFRIDPQSIYAGRQLQTLPLKKNILIANIVRRGKVIIPNGRDCIMPRDHIVVVTTNWKVNYYEDIFT